jgi:hypothetical protein
MKYILLLIVFLSASYAIAGEPDFGVVGSVKKESHFAKKLEEFRRKNVQVYNFIMPTIVGDRENPIETDPKPAIPDDEPSSPKPEGDGWEWDKQKGVWWKYVPNIGNHSFAIPMAAPMPMFVQPIQYAPPPPAYFAAPAITPVRMPSFRGGGGSYCGPSG